MSEDYVKLAEIKSSERGAFSFQAFTSSRALSSLQHVPVYPGALRVPRDLTGIRT